MNSVLSRIWRTPSGIVSTAVIVLILVTAVVAPILWGDKASTPNPQAVLLPPSLEHPLGTDQLGRDVLLRTLVATRLSVAMAGMSVLVGAVLGLLVGALPSLFGQRAQRLFGSILNTWLAFPMLLIAMFIVILVGNSPLTSVLALALVMAPVFARLVQTLTLKVSSADYVAAARLLGASRSRLLTRYIAPNIAEPAIVNITLGFAAALLAMSSLSFLGIGVIPPQYDWGRLLNDGFAQVYSTPIAVVGPGLAVVVAGLAVSGFGESLAAVLRDVPSARSGLSAEILPETAALEEAPGEAYFVVDGLHVAVPSIDGPVSAVRGISFSVVRGEIVGIVGESGSGKSLTMMAIAGLLPTSATARARRVELNGQQIDVGRNKPNGPQVGVIFQDSLTALNPALRIGVQLREAFRSPSKQNARALTVEALAEVGIQEPEWRVNQYPHEFSGGMRQRASVAMATLATPDLLIADEPTTALDPTTQKRVMKLICATARERDVSTIIVSHDIGALAENCDRVIVMYSGRIVEEVQVSDLGHPDRLAHPYARALVTSFPTLTTDKSTPLATIPGEPPSPSDKIPGCRFAPRCPARTDRCTKEIPPLITTDGRKYACWNPQNGHPIQ